MLREAERKVSPPFFCLLPVVTLVGVFFLLPLLTLEGQPQDVRQGTQPNTMQ